MLYTETLTFEGQVEEMETAKETENKSSEM